MSQNPFHLTARCPNREPFHCHLDEVWSVMEDYLFLMHLQYHLKIHCFVLMPNHYHLVASSLVTPVSTVMRDFMRLTSLALNQKSGRTNQTWGNRHYPCELVNYSYYMNTYKYVYQNPVRARLAAECEEWPYSTLHGLVGRRKLTIPVENDLLLFPDRFDPQNLSWLNTPISDNDRLQMKKCLARTQFKLPKQPGSRRPNVLENSKI